MFHSTPNAESASDELFLVSIELENSCTAAVVSRDPHLAEYLAKILGAPGPPLRVLGQDEIEPVLPPNSLIILGERQLEPRFFHGFSEVLARAKWSRKLVLCTEPTLSNLQILLRLRPTRSVFLGLHEKALLAEAVLACAEEDFFGEVFAELEQEYELASILRSALKRILFTLPPAPEEAVETMAAGGSPFPRTLRSIAEDLACSPSYLTEVAHSRGLSVSDILRWTIVLRGIILRRTSGRPWSEIAVSLGFRDLSGWTKFVKRLAHIPPSRTDEYPIRFWKQRFKEELSEKRHSLQRQPDESRHKEMG